MTASRVAADRGPVLSFIFDGEPVHAFEGETIASALLAAGVQEFGVTREGNPRAPLCNMGTCFDCAVTVNGKRLVRSCLSEVEAGMVVEKNEAS